MPESGDSKNTNTRLLSKKKVHFVIACSLVVTIAISAYFVYSNNKTNSNKSSQSKKLINMSSNNNPQSDTNTKLTNTNENNENNQINTSNGTTNANDNNTQNTNTNENPNENENENENNSNSDSNSKSKPKSKNENNNISNNNNNNNNNENDINSDEDDVKISGKKDDDKMKSSSSYYHFKSTDPKEAEKFKPKKIDSKQLEAKSISQGASAWNTGATMETFDYSEWVFNQITERLKMIQFKNCNIKINEIDKIEGHATIIFSRGKFRPGFDFHLKAKYNGNIDDKEIEGTINMPEICMDDDEEDWDYEVSSKKGGSAGKKAARIVKNSRDTVISVIHVVIEEFKKKK